MGRNLNYPTKEESIEANRLYKNAYMRKKEWRCEFCGNYNYLLAGKWYHLRTKKHKRNVEKVLNDK